MSVCVCACGFRFSGLPAGTAQRRPHDRSPPPRPPRPPRLVRNQRRRRRRSRPREPRQKTRHALADILNSQLPLPNYMIFRPRALTFQNLCRLRSSCQSARSAGTMPSACLPRAPAGVKAAARLGLRREGNHSKRCIMLGSSAREGEQRGAPPAPCIRRRQAAAGMAAGHMRGARRRPAPCCIVIHRLPSSRLSSSSAPGQRAAPAAWAGALRREPASTSKASASSCSSDASASQCSSDACPASIPLPTASITRCASRSLFRAGETYRFL